MAENDIGAKQSKRIFPPARRVDNNNYYYELIIFNYYYNACCVPMAILSQVRVGGESKSAAGAKPSARCGLRRGGSS